MPIQVGINGMGVVGRRLLLEICTRFRNGGNFQVTYINDPYMNAENLVYLLKHDSVYHDNSFNVEDMHASNIDGEFMSIDGAQVLFAHQSDVSNLNAPYYGATLMIDCTGQATSDDDLGAFMNTGVKNVLALYPVTLGYDKSRMIAYGINQKQLDDSIQFICMPTIEEQVAAIALNVLKNGNVNVNEAMVHAFTAYTNAQNTIDSSVNTAYHEEGRAGAWNIVPYISKSNFKNIEKVIPELNGKVTGMCYRAPVIAGGIIDISFYSDSIYYENDINNLFKNDVNGDLKGILEYQEDIIASSDALGLDMFQFLPGATRKISFMNNVTIVYDNIRGQVLQAIRILDYMKENEYIS